jgi:hypothetical protein
MTKEEQTITLNVAVCADSPDDQTVLKAYVKARGWKHSGHVYRFDYWQDVVADAKDGKFNTVCATYEGLRWLVHVAPETDFPRAQPKPKREPRSRHVDSDDEHHSAIVERARALTAEDAQTAETIAASLVADGLLGGAQGFALRHAFVARSSGRESLRRLNRKPKGRRGGGPGSQPRNRLSSQTVTRSSTRRGRPRQAFRFRSRSLSSRRRRLPICLSARSWRIHDWRHARPK